VRHIFFVEISGGLLNPPGLNGALDLGNRLGDFDFARAGFGAVERRAAAPHPKLLVQHFQPFGSRLIAAVEDEAVGVDNRRRADILPV